MNAKYRFEFEGGDIVSENQNHILHDRKMINKWFKSEFR